MNYFTRLAQTAKAHWFGWEFSTWLARLQGELDNLRAAMDWAVRNRDGHAGEQLIDGIFNLWTTKGYVAEGLRWINAILPDDGATSDLMQALKRYWVGQLAKTNGDFNLARGLLSEAAERAAQLGDDRLALQVNLALGPMLADRGLGAKMLSECIRLARLVGARHEEAVAMLALGRLMRITGDHCAAAVWLTDSLSLFRELENPASASYSLCQLGLAAFVRGDLQQARTAFEESIALARQTGCTVEVAESLVHLATVAVDEGDDRRAADAVRESIAKFFEMGNVHRVAQCRWSPAQSPMCAGSSSVPHACWVQPTPSGTISRRNS
jgi:non-specific serine/threonine protein kinase